MVAVRWAWSMPVTFAVITRVFFRWRRNPTTAWRASICTIDPAAASAVVDEHSYAEPNKVAIKDLSLDLKLDFDAKTLSGTGKSATCW